MCQVKQKRLVLRLIVVGDPNTTPWQLLVVNTGRRVGRDVRVALPIPPRVTLKFHSAFLSLGAEAAIREAQT
jgi:hypothetical protein